MQFLNIFKPIILTVGLIFIYTNNSEAAYYKRGKIGNTLICADSTWNIRYLNGYPSGKQLYPNECMHVDALTPEQAIVTDFKGNFYMKVRGISGTPWLLRIDQKIIRELNW